MKKRNRKDDAGHGIRIYENRCIECGKFVTQGTMQVGHLCMSCYMKEYAYCR